jgi:hypothetical protein
MTVVVLTCFAAGIAAVLLACGVALMVLMSAFSLIALFRHQDQIGWDPVSVTGRMPWIISFAVVFLLGFIWQFRRASRLS